MTGQDLAGKFGASVCSVLAVMVITKLKLLERADRQFRRLELGWFAGIGLAIGVVCSIILFMSLAPRHAAP